MPTKIEWTDESWNPIKMRCTKISPGCQNCYADRMLSRNLPGLAKYPAPGAGPILDKKSIDDPFHWVKPRRVFVESMGDLFHEFIPDYMLDKVFDRIMYDGLSLHTFIILTKRPERMKSYFESWGARLDLADNVWIGVTAENQHYADERIPPLLEIPAAVRFVSVEPILGPVSFRWAMWQPFGDFMTDHLDGLRRLDWIICGPETGVNKRPFNHQWALDIMAECKEAGVPFFAKTNKMCELGMVREWPELIPVS